MMDYPICQYHQGDWLIPYRKTEPDRVRTVSYQEEMAGIWCTLTFRHDRSVCHYPDSCTPIPITKEILERNFESEENIFGYKSYKLSADFILEHRGDRYCLVRKCNDNTSSTFWVCDICYVHELQHAFELVKINVDIVL